jgi:chromosome segregation ATPase
MTEQQNLFSRIGNFLKRGSRGGGANGELQPLDSNLSGGSSIEPRSTFLRPWARRDAAISQLHDGLHTLTELMSGIRENLERTSHRQDELLQYLAHLPQALESIPEANRIHGETLKAIHQQLAQQVDQQEKLTQILDHVGQAGGVQQEMLEGLRDRVESLKQTDEAVAQNIHSVSEAMQSVSKNSSTSTQVLEQMRDHIDGRDGQLERILHRQNTRFTTMLAVAIFLSVAALVAVSVVGYMLLNKR